MFSVRSTQIPLDPHWSVQISDLLIAAQIQADRLRSAQIRSDPLRSARIRSDPLRSAVRAAGSSSSCRRREPMSSSSRTSSSSSPSSSDSPRTRPPTSSAGSPTCSTTTRGRYWCWRGGPTARRTTCRMWRHRRGEQRAPAASSRFQCRYLPWYTISSYVMK